MFLLSYIIHIQENKYIPKGEMKSQHIEHMLSLSFAFSMLVTILRVRRLTYMMEKLLTHVIVIQLIIWQKNVTFFVYRIIEICFYIIYPGYFYLRIHSSLSLTSWRSFPSAQSINKKKIIRWQSGAETKFHNDASARVISIPFILSIIFLIFIHICICVVETSRDIQSQRTSEIQMN